MCSAGRLSIPINVHHVVSARMAAVRGGGIITSRKRCHSPVFAPTAIMSFVCGAGMRRNTVPIPAISQIVSGQVSIVTEFARILAYQSAMAQARVLMNRGLLSVAGLLKIEESMAGKYGLPYGDLYRDMDLITLGSRGNMPYYEGRD